MMLIAPVRTNSSNPPIAFGKPAAIPPNIKIEIPFPNPRSVICSPSHIKNMVPAVNVTTAVRRNPIPGVITKPADDSSARAIPRDWNKANPKVPYRVNCVIFRRPASPSFFICSKVGNTYVNNCMMIDAEIYGMIPNAKTVNRDKAPPENILKRLRMPPCCPLNNCCNCAGSIPGTGICAPTRYTTSASNKNTSRRRKSPNLPVFAICAALVAT